MRIHRAIAATATAAVMSVGAITGLAATSAQAAEGGVRVIDAKEPVQKTYNMFLMSGKVTEPVIDPATGMETGAYNNYVGVAKVHVKKCGKCKWSLFKKKITTNKFGVYKYRGKAPDKGVWKYRITVPASNGFAKVRSNPQGLWFD